MEIALAPQLEGLEGSQDAMRQGHTAWLWWCLAWVRLWHQNPQKKIGFNGDLALVITKIWLPKFKPNHQNAWRLPNKKLDLVIWLQVGCQILVGADPCFLGLANRTSQIYPPSEFRRFGVARSRFLNGTKLTSELVEKCGKNWNIHQSDQEFEVATKCIAPLWPKDGTSVFLDSFLLVLSEKMAMETHWLDD